LIHLHVFSACSLEQALPACFRIDADG